MAYPLTLIRAGAGYGKSTLINQALPEGFCPTVWFHLGEHDRDPIRFLFHLVSAVDRLYKGFGTKTLQTLAWDERQGYPNPYDVIGVFAGELKEIISGQLVIVLDDFQYIGDDPVLHALVEALTDLLPDNAHIIITSREKIRLPSRAIRRAQGQILEIGEDDLAFKAQEVKRFFLQSYNLSIDDMMAKRLVERTEGWIMAIHMLGERLQRGQSFEAAVAVLPQSMHELFAFLLQEFLRKQPADVRKFLSRSAYLQYLKAEDCDIILGIDNSAAILAYLEDRSFFTLNIGDGLYRYHHLFQEYLQKASSLSRSELTDFHRRAAAYYQDCDLAAMAVSHLLAGGWHREAGLLVKEIYQQELASGRQAELVEWLAALPADIVNSIPELLVCRGDLNRLRGDFAEALALYSQAEREFATQDDKAGKYLVAKAVALVYLDTVQPVLAEEYLGTALSLVGRDNTQERARLLQLMAENQTNLGCSEKAAELFRQANELFMEDSRGDVEARMHLRTGRLAAAKSILLRQEQQKNPSRLPKSHRETPLLLSLINAFMGDSGDALSNASEGLSIARRLNAAFVEAVAFMRLGHAQQLRSWTNMKEAQECYQQALEISSSLGVERGKAEPLFGLCLLHGYQGNLDSAERFGLEGLKVAQAAKDDWMAAMIQLALAIAYYRNGATDKAQERVQAAEASFIRCGDSFLSAAAMFWHAKMLLEKDDTAFRAKVDALLLQTQSHGYDFLFYRPTLMGVRDVHISTPLLLAAQREGIRSAYAGSLLTELGVNAEISHHPGYTLRVQTLGDFRIWRGLEEIKQRDWQREKAKRLFQYLLTNRHKLVHKEQIVEALWGEDGSDSDFKVALNAMTTALEPGRNARTTSFYISKQSGTYGLNLASRISLDVDEFESYINRGDHIVDKDPEQAIKLYRLAINLYYGDYIPECCYEDWCIEERERLLLLYIMTAEKLSLALYERGELEECISLCIRILGKDRCWETAYQTLMRCYHRQNNLALVTRAFNHCRNSLRDELGVQPSAKTSELYRQLMG